MSMDPRVTALQIQVHELVKQVEQLEEKLYDEVNRLWNR